MVLMEADAAVLPLLLLLLHVRVSGSLTITSIPLMIPALILIPMVFSRFALFLSLVPQ